jgi:hypothetical protein
MKSAHLLKIASAAVLTASVAVLPFTPASAQVTEPRTYPQQVENNADWGWLGLLGLIGLAGLFGNKNRHRDTDTSMHNDRFRDREEVTTAGRDPYR